mmetsp:Transcript_21897/g.62081  ORF Transcript_21897/g.62081 Transcript_21897/m.62081 type:complete len:225 (+) Transcript_21897:308-982(+)
MARRPTHTGAIRILQVVGCARSSGARALARDTHGGHRNAYTAADQDRDADERGQDELGAPSGVHTCAEGETMQHMCHRQGVYRCRCHEVPAMAGECHRQGRMRPMRSADTNNTAIRFHGCFCCSLCARGPRSGASLTMLWVRALRTCCRGACSQAMATELQKPHGASPDVVVARIILLHPCGAYASGDVTQRPKRVGSGVDEVRSRSMRHDRSNAFHRNSCSYA